MKSQSKSSGSSVASKYYAMRVTLYNNTMYETYEEADKAAEAWLDRLAGRDNPHTWDECDWQVVEVYP